MTPPTATATVPATSLVRRRARPRRGHPRPLQRQTDADVYAGIARAWWSLYSDSERHEHLMRTYLVRPGFAQEVWGRSDVDPQDVLAACARLVSMEDYRMREAAQMTRAGGKLRESLDPRHGWWAPLAGTPELGIHFWQLVLVPVDLRSIGPVDEPPLLQYGRFGPR